MRATLQLANCCQCLHQIRYKVTQISDLKKHEFYKFTITNEYTGVSSQIEGIVEKLAAILLGKVSDTKEETWKNHEPEVSFGTIRVIMAFSKEVSFLP